MNIISDLHIHGRYSQATSDNLTIPNLEKYARIKGINLMGTGDFTHPKWIQHIKEELADEDNTGIFKTKSGFNFMLTSELSLIYSQGGKGRRVHNILFAPNLDVVQQITDYLLTKGRIDYDGRPIFKIPCPEFSESLKKISNDIEIIPAHCLTPDSLIHTQERVKKIKEAREKDKVLTHRGRYKIIKKIYKRRYSGKIIQIVPSSLKIGDFFTPEHPVYSIKTYKECKNVSHTICKPTCAYLKRGCKNRAFEKYKPEWTQIKDLKKGDIVLFPRFNYTKDIASISLNGMIKGVYVYNKDNITPRKCKPSVKNAPIKDNIEISKDFCRLIGYYLAEGYCTRDHIGFTFSTEEKRYVEDVKGLIKKIFGEFVKIQLRQEKSKGISILVFSKTLKNFFEIFYSDKPYRSFNKRIPEWIIGLPAEKLKEVIVGWWRGDSGYTTSVNLLNHFKLIFIKLGIIPVINKISAESTNRRRSSKLNKIEGRRIVAKHDLFYFSGLSFFKESVNLRVLPEFKKFLTKLERRKGWVDKEYIYLPIIGINTKNYNGQVYNLEVEEDNSYLTENLAVHNCWTPWFGMLGSMSGFDSVKDCFQDQTKNIFALETGLSSNPAMNWRLSQLDRFSLVSFSDLHSYWPWRIGREATLFDLKELAYKNIIKALRTKEGMAGTVEVDPSYGKYHIDGHRKCNFCSEPKETRKFGGICPVCKKPMTIGVLYRVEELADRPEGYKPKDAKKFYSLIPLSEIISLLLGKAVSSKGVWKEYNSLVTENRPEFDVLLNVPEEELYKITTEKIAKTILLNREGKIRVKPGYDGEYGVPLLEGAEINEEVKIEPPKNPPKQSKQKSLADFA